jgi:cytosine/adenosine deaminase-related metal-dependent hydrolase
MRHILGNATVITVDRDRRILLDGAVAFEGDTILAVGKTSTVREEFPSFVFLDMKEHVIMPGLINAHVHLTQALIKGCADDMSLIDFLANRIWRLMGNYDEKDACASANICMLEMLKSGTTTFAETLLLSRYGLDGITKAVVDSGMRGMLAKSVMDIATYATRDNIMFEGMVEDGETCLRQAVDWKNNWENAGNGRIQIWLGPRPVGSTTLDILKKVSATAREYGLGIAIHFCEVKQDLELMRSQYQMTPGVLAETAGILTDRTLLIHSVWLTRDDMRIIRKYSSSVVHCPASNLKLASGFCPVPELFEEGINVALGTDAATCDNAHDMFDAMRLAAIVHKGRTLDPMAVPAESVIEMATINGARAIGLEDQIGSLEAGKKADIITIDMRSPRLVPNVNPVSAVVYSAKGSDVDNVVIDGRFVVRDRAVLTMDENKVVAEAISRVGSAMEKAGVVNAPKWPMI